MLPKAMANCCYGGIVICYEFVDDVMCSLGAQF